MHMVDKAIFATRKRGERRGNPGSDELGSVAPVDSGQALMPAGWHGFPILFTMDAFFTYAIDL